MLDQVFNGPTEEPFVPRVHFETRKSHMCDAHPPRTWELQFVRPDGKLICPILYPSEMQNAIYVPANAMHDLKDAGAIVEPSFFNQDTGQIRIKMCKG